MRDSAVADLCAPAFRGQQQRDFQHLYRSDGGVPRHSLRDDGPSWRSRSRKGSEIEMNTRLHPLRFGDRKSTRLNSSHVAISYAVFCLKKKMKKYTKDIASCV